MQPYTSQSAFSLLECLVTLSIMAILSTLAVPSYVRFSRRAFYSNILQTAAPYQFAVALCAQEHGGLQMCNHNHQQIPDAISHSHHIDSLKVHQGIIHIMPQAEHGLLKSDDLQLTPILDDIGLSWVRSGGAVDKGYVT